MNASAYRHPKEKMYYSISLFISIFLHVLSLGSIFLFALVFALPVWISEQLFKAIVFGNAIKVSDKQFPKLNNIINRQITELGLEKNIDVFVCNGQGITNAFAVKFLSKKYVILMSDLVDLMLKREAYSELEMIIGHELAHHALKHTSMMRNVILLPAKFIPFLYLAYTRGCEFSADMIGFELTKTSKTAIRGLISIVLGSEALSDDIDVAEFAKQERNVPGFFGWLHDIFSTHPRMTRRIEELLPKWDLIPQLATRAKPETVMDESRFMPQF